MAGNTLPCMVSPERLEFTDAPEDRLQTLKILNPHKFELRYKIFANLPGYYSVPDSEGSIKPEHVKELGVSLRSSILEKKKPLPPRVVLRVRVTDPSDTRTGHKDVPLLASVSRHVRFSRDTSGSEKSKKEKPSVKITRVAGLPGGASSAPGFILTFLPVILGLGVLIAGFESESRAMQGKLLLAFLLGMITMYIQSKTLRAIELEATRRSS